MEKIMRVIAETGLWAIEHDGKPVAIDGTVWHSNRNELVAAIKKRGLRVKKDDTIVRMSAVAPEEAAPRKRGRPRQFTPEEAAERLKEAKRRYNENRSEEARQRHLERIRQWKLEHPDKVAEAGRKSTENRKERYKNDPEYREKIRAYQREYARKRRAEKRAEQ